MLCKQFQPRTPACKASFLLGKTTKFQQSLDTSTATGKFSYRKLCHQLDLKFTSKSESTIFNFFT